MHPPRDLSADCSRCVGLCCVVLPFARSHDFAFDKAAGEPCRHLTGTHACAIHDRLRPAGFAGCTVFDCFGAGQRVVQETYGGDPWAAAPEAPDEVRTVFEVVRQLHEMLVLLAEAGRRSDGHACAAEALAGRVEAAGAGTPEQVLSVDVGTLRVEVGDLLGEVSARLRDQGGASLRGADLVGRDLRAEHLGDADLRGALLVGADLRGAPLGRADLLGADLRGADVAQADLSQVLFLTQPQLDASRGSGTTLVPPGLRRPAWWV